MSRILNPFRDGRGSGLPAHAILIGLGVVIALAAFVTAGHALYGYFQSFAQCLNGC